MDSKIKQQLDQQQPSNSTNSISNTVWPHLINGHLCEENKNAFSLSTNGYLAFACYNKVIILETINQIRLCQNLNRHKYYVNKVLWCNDNSFKLLSTDSKGNIIVWNVIEGSVLTIITPQNKEDKQLLDICWTKYNNDSFNNNTKQSNILCLYSNNTFVIYDSDKGISLWRKCFSSQPENDYLICNFQIDPFNDQNLILSLSNCNQNNSECCFARLTDIYQKGNLSIYQIYLSNSEESASNINSPKSQLNQSTNTATSTTTTTNYLQRYVNLVGNSFQRTNLNILSVTHILEYIKLIHHSSNLDQILIAFEREIHLVDLNFKQIISVIRIENNCGNLSDIYSCWQRNALICLHQNGSISFRKLQKKKRRKEHIGTDVCELNYVLIAISDGLRLTKYNKIFGFEINRLNELEIYLISNNEKINVYKLYSSEIKERKNHNLLTLNDYLDLNEEYVQNRQLNKQHFNLIMYKMYNCITKGRHIIKTGPHLIYKNWFYHRPLIAIGDQNGLIQIFNLATNQLEKQYSIHTVAVRGIEWVNLNVILSYAYGNNGTKLCNELKITDINTGYSVLIREERNESTPIEILKVSHFKNYFIITFKHEPFEIWDLRNLCCLKQMSAFQPNITSVEWIPISNKDSKSQSKTKEYFMITNSDSELYHFYVEGSNIKKILSTPHLSGGITATAWKNDQLIFGDSDGNITLWNLRTKVSKAECTLRGPIKKFSFGPGKSYLKLLVLFSDGVDLWNIKEMKLEAQIKHPRDIEFKIDDIDWASMDRPILLTPEGFLLISDSKLKVFHSAMNFNLNNSNQIENSLDSLSENNEIKFNFKELGRMNYQILTNENKLRLSTDLINNRLVNMPNLDSVDKSIQLAKLMGRLDLLQFFELVKHYCKLDYKVDTFYENFVKNDYFKQLQRDKVAIYELKRTRPEHNELCNEYHLYLGNDQRTVQLLLETETNFKNLYLKDSLKACLISLLLQSEKNSTNLSHPVIKLVATNLIANESTDEGIQLLFIIGKIIDACRYLQSNNSWSSWKKSLFLSKTNLPKDEFIDVNSRWPDYLGYCKKDKDKLFALISLEMYEKVINYLIDHNDYKFASIYCDICIEYNLVDKSLFNLFKRVYSKYIEYLEEANLQYLIPVYQHKINYLEEKVDKFNLINEEELKEVKKVNYSFKYGYLKNWNESDILLDDIIMEEVEDEDDEEEENIYIKKEEIFKKEEIVKKEEIDNKLDNNEVIKSVQ